VRIAVSQPTYLPWLGYFDLIDQADTFVLLDNVQFQKQSWQQRNRIKGPTGLQWLSVPVVFRGLLGQRINEVVIRDAGFPADHLRAIELSYRKAPFFDHYFEQITKIFEKYPAGSLLVQLNVELIKWFCLVFSIKTPLLCSSGQGASGRRSDLLVNLSLDLRATTYLSAPGSATYLLEDLTKFSNAGIEVAFHNYMHPEYQQRFPPFVPYAAALDLLFNEGDSSPEILRSGRKRLLSPGEFSVSTGAGVSA
jgi:hypothetical protein